jgi:transcriptional regulator with XRE-family HTH domain
MSQDEAPSSAEYFSYEERRRTLKKLRKQAKISQRRLAELCGVTHFTIGRFENGRQDVSPKTLKKMEEALSDALAGLKITALLHAQRTRTGSLAQMAPPPAGTEEYWQARDQFVRRGSRRMTELMLENAQLREDNARLGEQVGILKQLVERLQEQTSNWHEAFTLQSEVIRLFEQEEVKRPKEADALLERTKVLAGKK